ncbi:pleckstrin homology domain-containing family A member 2 [Xenopus tropicalis]|nr:pleckstrin homology domain-containing family A member 2 [Xenopus tropicalis]AAI67382.1 LOC100170478 protein [Xenopus tropicalis]|eukprot:NP_001123733.1 pleckstrin homology domain-containing family A member 2 [Xenopus tropicalis]
MPYVDRQNRTCGFLDIEDEGSGRFLRRYFILDTQANYLLWYMDNPQNLPNGTGAVGCLKLTYISKVDIATVKQKAKAKFCFVIKALSQRYFLQASDQNDLLGWVEALNSASKITVPRPTPATAPEVGSAASGSAASGSAASGERRSQIAYRTEIIGGVVVQTAINQNGGESHEVTPSELPSHSALRRTQSQYPVSLHKSQPSRSFLKSGYCVKQGNVRKNWKRRFFVLDVFSISYFKSSSDREPLRRILLREILKTHECLVKSGDLLLRDNLFEIITAPRTFYIQADSPQEMHSWIKAINAAVQTLRMRYRETCFGRTMSLNRSCIPGPSSESCSEDKRPLGKSSSVKSSWQPWTPVPKCDTEAQLALASTEESGESGGRMRHSSEPQWSREKQLLYSLDNMSLRTSDV